MKNQYRLLLIALFIAPLYAHAGWARTYGGTDDDYGSCIRQTSDSGYVIVGQTYSFSKTPGTSDLWFVKIDPEGDTQRTHTYGGPMNDWGAYVQQTRDAGYIVTGLKDADGYGYQGDLWLLKTDSLGDTIWTRSYGLPGLTDRGQFVYEMDSGYMILGETESQGAGGRDVWILRIDESGDTLWTKTYGDSTDDLLISAQLNHQFVFGYVLFIQSFTMGTQLVRIDTSGEVFSVDESPGGNINYIQERWSPGGYLCVGWRSPVPDDPSEIFLGATYPFDIATYDWTAMWGGEGVQEGYCVENGVGSNAYIVTGVSCRTDEYPNLILSERGYFGGERFNRIFGGDGYDYGYRVLVIPDSGYMVLGSTDSYGAGKMDLWLIKTDSLGYVGIEEPPPVTPVTPVTHLEIISPIGPTVTLRYSNCPNGFAASVYDAGGRKVDEIKSSNQAGVLSWGSHQSPGVYFIVSNGTSTKPMKAVIVR